METGWDRIYSLSLSIYIIYSRPAEGREGYMDSHRARMDGWMDAHLRPRDDLAMLMQDVCERERERERER